MNNDKEIQKVNDLLSILENKLSESQRELKIHEAKLKYHQDQAIFHKSRVEYIRKFLPQDADFEILPPKTIDNE